MAYAYTPTYYSSIQDTITSLCKSILPFSLKNRRLPPDQKLAKQHSDNLKWQQDSFHRILNLIGLHKEGIVPESDVTAFRSHLLDTLIASPAHPEPVSVIRDKLLFLQELFYAKCISAEEYHSSKRPLLQRLAVQGAEINCRDVIVGAPGMSTEEWSVIDLRDKEPTMTTEKTKHKTPVKSFISNVASPYKSWRGKGKENSKNPNINAMDSSKVSMENPFGEKHKNSNRSSILMPESSPLAAPVKSEPAKRKPFHALFQRDQNENKEPSIPKPEEKVPKSSKKQWGFDGFKKWKRSDSEDESTTPYLPPGERSDDASPIPCTLVASPFGEGPDTKKRTKKMMHSDGSASNFSIDKVLGENIKKELSRIQSELSAKNPNLNFSNEQIEAISTRLPVDKADLNNFFPKSWCDRYGDIVLDVVRKEFKDHVSEMETLRNATGEKNGSAEKWVAFEDNDENMHINLFSEDQALLNHKVKDKSNGCFANYHFHDDQNPFWSPRGK
ncbi:uncharacterized protein [Elaeis guineensis]|uniref:Uncharacterized protein LOC105050092 n=1 Tax=Elaeis guineensis var. tenera TaxID=51953 RepID=A0A6I9RKF3_ELAGV|nr:uncharacterized protein LOC105050092 [Elaeis guineensis]